MKEYPEIALRAYIPSRKPKKPAHIVKEERSVLVIDTETTEDEYQSLLFGSCGIWVSGYLHKFVLFYDPNLPKKKLDIISEYAETQKIGNIRIKVMPVKEFVNTVFYPWTVRYQALCLGFSLGFDLSRLATKHGYGRKGWKNGFTFWLTEDSKYPRLRIRSLDSVRSFFGLAPTKYSGKVKGRFLDLRTLGFALTDKKLSLKDACELFNTQQGKVEVKQHGQITASYVDYNVNDTKITYELYTMMMTRLKEFNLDLSPEMAFSPASLGKAYLRKIGIQPFGQKNPNFQPEILGYLMTTYYGGRSEVKIRETPVRVRLMDFKSMYPTLFVLMDLWKFLLSQTVEYYDSTEEVKQLLSRTGLKFLTDKSLYPHLVSIVQIQPDGDILPVRAHYGEDKTVYNIGLNYVTSEIPLWYTLPDVIASKLLTGKMPKILRAISFKPAGIQENLRPIEIPGGYKLNPEDNLVKSLIQYRKEIQDRRDNLSKDTPAYNQLEVIQEQLKILANATSYGIFIEVNTEDEPTEAQAYGLDTFQTDVSKTEELGEFFNPILATILTGGARLMLAMAESWLKQHGGYYTFCDTDSMAVSPFHWKPLQTFFQSLNPYESDAPLLKLEYDDRDASGRLSDLWFYGISTKRYVLFQLVDGQPSIVEDGWSSHGLGHLLHGNNEDDDKPRNSWEKELWTRIINTAMGNMSEKELCEKYSGEYAVSRFTVTKASLHRRLQAINRRKEISKQIKPFNFILTGSPQEISDAGKPIHPVTKFNKKIDEAPFQPFIDYNTGKQYPGGNQLYWKQLPTIIKEYVNHPENKFRNGKEKGKMKRRHLFITQDQINYLGKEANEIEETEILGVTEDTYVKYEMKTVVTAPSRAKCLK